MTEAEEQEECMQLHRSYYSNYGVAHSRIMVLLFRLKNISSLYGYMYFLDEMNEDYDGDDDDGPAHDLLHGWQWSTKGYKIKRKSRDE